MTRFAPLLAALLLASTSATVLAYGGSPQPHDDDASHAPSGNETNDTSGNASGESWNQPSRAGTDGSNQTEQDPPPSSPGDNATRDPPPPAPTPERENGTDEPERQAPQPPAPAESEQDRAQESAGNGATDDNAQAGERPPTPTRSADDRRNPPPPAAKGATTVRDTPDGFETVPPPAAQRPGVRVDARDGLVQIERAGVDPLATRLVSLLEYADEDGDGAYDLGERVVTSHALRGREPTVIADEGSLARDVVYPLEGGGRLVLRFTLDPVGEGIGAKFDVLIEDYAFASPDTRLALGMHVESTSPLEPTQVNGAPAVAVSTGSEAAYLSWVTNVTVDGADHPVGWSVHTSSSDASAIVYWSYPQGARILHDPALGIMQVARDLLGQPMAFVAGLAATGVVLGAGFEARRRMRR